MADKVIGSLANSLIVW